MTFFLVFVTVNLAVSLYAEYRRPSRIFLDAPFLGVVIGAVATLPILSFYFVKDVVDR